jgi:hypothetical protein
VYLCGCINTMVATVCLGHVGEGGFRRGGPFKNGRLFLI